MDDDRSLALCSYAAGEHSHAFRSLLSVYDRNTEKKRTACGNSTSDRLARSQASGRCTCVTTSTCRSAPRTPRR